MKIGWQRIASIIFIILLLGLQIAYWFDPITFSDIVAVQSELFHFIEQFPQFSAFIYIGLYTLSIIFGMPVSTTIIGGYLFGVAKGSIYSLIAIMLGSGLLCSFVRYTISDWIKTQYKDQLDPFNKEIKKYGMYYLLFVHAIPFMPSFLPHIAAGISSIPLYQIVLANLIGALPTTILYTVAGAYIHTITSWKSFITYMSIVASCMGVLLGAVWLYYRLRKKS